MKKSNINVIKYSSNQTTNLSLGKRGFMAYSPPKITNIQINNMVKSSGIANLPEGNSGWISS